MMILAANTERMIEASGTITTAIAGSDLRHHITAHRVGNIVGWRQLWALTSAAGAFAQASAGQLGVIATAIALGADDVIRVDLPWFEAEGGA